MKIHFVEWGVACGGCHFAVAAPQLLACFSISLAAGDLLGGVKDKQYQ